MKKIGRKFEKQSAAYTNDGLMKIIGIGRYIRPLVHACYFSIEIVSLTLMHNIRYILNP